MTLLMAYCVQPVELSVRRGVCVKLSGNKKSATAAKQRVGVCRLAEGRPNRRNGDEWDASPELLTDRGLGPWSSASWISI